MTTAMVPHLRRSLVDCFFSRPDGRAYYLPALRACFGDVTVFPSGFGGKAASAGLL
jgi:hypothetical protein